MDKFIGRKDSVLEAEVGFEEQGGRIKNEKLRMKNYELRVTSYLVAEVRSILEARIWWLRRSGHLRYSKSRFLCYSRHGGFVDNLILMEFDNEGNSVYN